MHPLANFPYMDSINSLSPSLRDDFQSNRKELNLAFTIHFSLFRASICLFLKQKNKLHENNYYNGFKYEHKE